MDTVVIVGIAFTLLGAGAVYVLMEYKQFGERQKASAQLAKNQTEVAAIRKELVGYTKYAEYLPGAKGHLADNAKSLQAKVVREFTYTETFNREAKNLKPPVTIIQHYNVEANFAFDLKPGSFELVSTPAGVEVQLHGKPTLQGIANARPTHHEISNEGVLENEPVAVKQIQQKLIGIAQRHGETMATEDAICALCERKVAESLRTLLITQNGVRQVPFVSFFYK
jgi:hypothetical protein